jgi:hypothetical protein
MKIPLDRDVDQFPVFDVVLRKRGRGWQWRVCTAEGDVVMQGSESIRPAAKYKAERALFLLLLSAPYRSIRLSNSANAGRSGRITRGLPSNLPSSHFGIGRGRGKIDLSH